MIDIDIKTILPQQPPFVMVDELLHCDNIVTKTSFTVREELVFVSNGVFTEPGVVENIAQTCAARMGYVNSVINDGNVKVGYIGSIKNLQIYHLPVIGDKLETTIEVQNEVFNFLLVKAKVECGEKLIAECEMKISEQ